MSSNRVNDKRLFWLIAIFALALAFRLIIVGRLAMPPANDLLWNDAVGWNLANGRGFTASQAEPRVPGVFRTPGYPAFLAVIYLLAGHSHRAAFLAQAILDSLVAVLAALIGLRLLDAGIGYAAGLIYAINPYSAIHCGILSQDILLTFTISLTLYLIVLTASQTGGTGKRSLWFLVGISIGCAALVKAFLVLYVIVSLIVQLHLLRNPRRFVVAAAITFLGIGILTVPWGVRNYLCFRRFPPLAAGGTGTNLMYLAEELRDGENALVGRQEVAAGDRLSSAGYLRRFVDGVELIDKEFELAQEAKGEIKRRWPAYIPLVLKHIPRLWITKYTIGQSTRRQLAATGLSIVTLLSGLVGMVLLWRERLRLLPLYLSVIVITLVYAPYTAEARYTLPARPAMIVFIAAILVAGFNKVRGHRELP